MGNHRGAGRRKGGRPELLPECERVYTFVHISGLVLLGLRVADGHTDTADSGVTYPMQSPLHGDGAGCDIGDLKALDRAGSWETKCCSALPAPPYPWEDGGSKQQKRLKKVLGRGEGGGHTKAPE